VLWLAYCFNVCLFFREKKEGKGGIFLVIIIFLLMFFTYAFKFLLFSVKI
jgi:hypothetical protein